LFRDGTQRIERLGGWRIGYTVQAHGRLDSNSKIECARKFFAEVNKKYAAENMKYNMVHQPLCDAPFDAFEAQKHPEIHRNAQNSGNQLRVQN
jgi:hypothetical protein